MRILLSFIDPAGEPLGVVVTTVPQSSLRNINLQALHRKLKHLISAPTGSECMITTLCTCCDHTGVEDDVWYGNEESKALGFLTEDEFTEKIIRSN